MQFPSPIAISGNWSAARSGMDLTRPGDTSPLCVRTTRCGGLWSAWKSRFAKRTNSSPSCSAQLTFLFIGLDMAVIIIADPSMCIHPIREDRCPAVTIHASRSTSADRCDKMIFSSSSFVLLLVLDEDEDDDEGRGGEEDDWIL